MMQSIDVMIHENSPETYRSTNKMTKSLLNESAEHIKQNKYSHKNFNLENVKFNSEFIPQSSHISKPEITIASKNLIVSPKNKKSSKFETVIPSVKKPVNRKSTALIIPELTIDGETPAFFQGT